MAKAEMNTSNAGGGMMVQPNRSCPRNVECRKPGPVVCPGRQMMATNTASTNNKQKLNAIEGSTSPRSRTAARMTKFTGKRKEIASNAMRQGPIAYTLHADSN